MFNIIDSFANVHRVVSTVEPVGLCQETEHPSTAAFNRIRIVDWMIAPSKRIQKFLLSDF